MVFKSILFSKFLWLTLGFLLYSWGSGDGGMSFLCTLRLSPFPPWDETWWFLLWSRWLGRSIDTKWTFIFTSRHTPRSSTIWSCLFYIKLMGTTCSIWNSGSVVENWYGFGIWFETGVNDLGRSRCWVTFMDLLCWIFTRFLSLLYSIDSLLFDAPLVAPDLSPRLSNKLVIFISSSFHHQ